VIGSQWVGQPGHFRHVRLRVFLGHPGGAALCGGALLDPIFPRGFLRTHALEDHEGCLLRSIAPWTTRASLGWTLFGRARDCAPKAILGKFSLRFVKGYAPKVRYLAFELICLARSSGECDAGGSAIAPAYPLGYGWRWITRPSRPSC